MGGQDQDNIWLDIWLDLVNNLKRSLMLDLG